MFRTAGLRAVALASALAAALVLGGATPAGAEAGGNSANAHLCQEGGWQNLTTADGEGFANQGGCVSYAAQGGTLRPKRPPQLRFVTVCAGAGSYSQFLGRVDVTVIWECYFREGIPSLETRTALAAICEEAGGRFEYGTKEYPAPYFAACFIPTSS